MHHRNPSVAIIYRQSTVAAVIRCIIEALQQHIRWVGLASTRPFGINRNCQKQGRSQLEKEAVGQVSVPIRGKYLPPSDTSLLLIPPIRGKYLFLSISCLSQASALGWGGRAKTICRSCCELQFCCVQLFLLAASASVLFLARYCPAHFSLTQRKRLAKARPAFEAKNSKIDLSQTVYPIHKSFKAQGIMAQVIRRVNQRSI